MNISQTKRTGLERWLSVNAPVPQTLTIREALEIIVMNAVIQPDASMGGTTDVYAVPLEDIQAARAALKRGI